MANDALSPAAAHNSRSSSKRSPATSTWTRKASRTTWCAGQCAWLPGRVIGGKASATVARSQLCAPRRVAVRRPRCGAHVPAVGGVQITAASRCSAINAAFSSADAGYVLRSRPLPAGATRRDPILVRFVGHRANQRMMEHILGSPGEAHLIDESAAKKSRNRFNPKTFPASRG